MKRLFALVLLLSAYAFAAPPQANLLVEMRWVDSGVSGAALAGVRQGGVVVGTAGSVSPHPGGFTASTRKETVELQQPLMVLNGRKASLMIKDEQLDYELDFIVPRPNAEPKAVLRQRTRERQRGFAVTPTWPGGKNAPVEVEIRALSPEQDLLSTVLAPLGDWVTVARAAPASRPEPGTVSSRDAQRQAQRELQLRVQLAP